MLVVVLAVELVVEPDAVPAVELVDVLAVEPGLQPQLSELSALVLTVWAVVALV